MELGDGKVGGLSGALLASILAFGTLGSTSDDACHTKMEAEACLQWSVTSFVGAVAASDGGKGGWHRPDGV